MRGRPAKLFWCTVSGGGSSWTADSSGPEGQETGPIYQQTVFTLDCDTLDGSTVHETATVGVVPVFQEI